MRGAFPRIVTTDAAQVGEDPVDDAEVLDHGDTFHLDATLGAEQRVDLEDPAQETRPTPTPRPRGGGVVVGLGVGADIDLGARRTIFPDDSRRFDIASIPATMPSSIRIS